MIGRSYRRRLGVGWIGLALVVTVASEAAAQTWSTSVRAPDGTRLATDVYLPLALLPAPSVLIRTPYDKDDLDTVCLAVTVLGFACVAQDTRGRYDSGGEDTVFRDDGADGRATVAWLVDQWWSDGTLCTFGASALGITEYLLAPGVGAEPRCMVAAAATPDLYHHAVLQGGALREELVTNWLADHETGDFVAEASQHRLRDAWWDPLDALADPATVDAAMLHVGGWYDIFLQGTLDAFVAYQEHGGAGARGRQTLVIGPWSHTSAPGAPVGELQYPADAALDLLALSVDWLEHWLDGPADGSGWPAVRVYLMGAVEAHAPGNLWLELPRWPPPSTPTPWQLGADGVLSLAPALPGEIELLIDPADPVPTLGGANLFDDMAVDGRPLGAGPFDQRPIEARADVLTFTTAPLAEPVTIIGRLRCRLWVRPDTLDLDLSVRLSDVYPDGRSLLVADGIQRARMRCGDDRECLLTPGVPTEIEVDLWSTALVFAPGHRIRVAVAGSNWPRFELNANDGGPLDAGQPTVARPAILTGPDTPSAIVLPVVAPPRTPGGRVGS